MLTPGRGVMKASRGAISAIWSSAFNQIAEFEIPLPTPNLAILAKGLSQHQLRGCGREARRG
jgi:hypothetical protein